MFDYFRSSYDLGEDFTEVECHTKDIEDGIGGTMTLYWLDPAGQLWMPEYRGTHDFIIYKEGDPEYVPNKFFSNHEWIPTGKHGRFIPYKITKYIRIYPSEWEGEWEDWPDCRLHFVDGVLKDYKRLTKGDKEKY